MNVYFESYKPLTISEFLRNAYTVSDIKWFLEAAKKFPNLKKISLSANLMTHIEDEYIENFNKLFSKPPYMVRVLCKSKNQSF